MNRTILILLGMILVFSGVVIWFIPVYFSSRFGITFDFNSIKWPFGGILIIIGFYFIWSPYREKSMENKRSSLNGEKVLMCLKCVKPFFKKDCEGSVCPECKGPLEELKGFYERHPELKNKK